MNLKIKILEGLGNLYSLEDGRAEFADSYLNERVDGLLKLQNNLLSAFMENSEKIVYLGNTLCTIPSTGPPDRPLAVRPESLLKLPSEAQR
jgi:hypothetical protein